MTERFRNRFDKNAHDRGQTGAAMYNILIVDDSTFDLDCISFLIRKNHLPLRVSTAVNGNSALLKFQESDIFYDILFTDIKMPMMDGLELSGEVKRISPDTEIILYSGFNEFEYAKTAIKLGVNEYLLKPIDARDFLSSINSLLAKIDQRKKERADRAKLLETCRLSGENLSDSSDSELSDILDPVEKQRGINTTEDHLKLDQIKSYICHNYSVDLSLNRLSELFYISPNYLCTLFKKETGINLVKFINDYRLKKAAELLIQSPMKIHMVSESVGFHNTSYFCQRFRDYFGVSPETYRLKKGQLT